MSRTFLDELEDRRLSRSEEAAAALGLGGRAAELAALPVLDRGPLIRLAVLAAASSIPIVLFASLVPEMSDAVGASRVALTGFTLAGALATVLAAAGLGVLGARRRSVRLAGVVALTTVVGAALAAVAGTTGGLALAMVAASLGYAATRVLHPAALVDHYPPTARTRVLSLHRGADTVGRAAAFALAAALAPFDLTWRVPFLVAFALAATATVACFAPAPATGSSAPDSDARPFGEEVRRAWRRPTVSAVLGVWAALGAFTLPLVSFAGFFLVDRWRVATGGRLGLLALIALAALPALAFVARRVEVAFSADPSAPLRAVVGAAAAGAIGLIVAVVSPIFFFAVAGLAVAMAAATVAVPMLDLAGLSVVDPSARTLVAAGAQLSYLLIGGLGGVLVFGGIDRRFGLGGALVALLVPAALVGVLARRAAVSVEADLVRSGADRIVADELDRYAGAGGALPLMVCRGINFSYGPLQVLFNVDFTVEDGQLVALLGTNGAGKSTLLRVISGLGYPARGTVHLAGNDITFVDPEDRVRLGIGQIPGGRAVFGPLTVAENLRVFAGRAGANVDDAFAAFPRLAERRNQPAAMLSGGEQQMLALSKALLTRPRLLLIDELSLGLAPNVVAELLRTVRAINTAGTAVVLVEQSVNVALSIAEHAYFMEKGEVRFDGPAKKLLDRKDLIRAVFLSGAAKRMGGKRP